jgi:hypothetical protein
MFRRRHHWIRLLSALLVLAGCSRGPARVDAPSVDPESAADKAIELYDSNQDQSLSNEELADCPGILASLSLYDPDGNRRVDRHEIVQRLKELLKNRVGLTQLRSHVTFRGKPLVGATIVFEPEPYLGTEVEAARGTTNSHGSAQMSVSEDILPGHVRTMKLMHYGTYKVRITHPSIKLPAKYNTQTTLGYETRIGDPFATFTLTVP